jgi:iron complex transport system permease protein
MLNVSAVSVIDPPRPAELAPPAPAPSPRAAGIALRTFGLLVAVGALVLVLFASVAYGSKSISLGTVVDALRHYDATDQDQVIIRTLRVPRTIVGLLVGAALGLAGTLMQGVTRNPLADPGILGVNGGAALFVVIGIHWFGIGTLSGYVWFAFAGAGIAAVVVYAIGSMGREGATPVKLALAGAAVSAMLASATTAVLLVDASTLDQYRFWAVGSLSGRSTAIVTQVLPFFVVGTVMALASGRVLNALSLGDDVARSLGQRVGPARAFAALGVVVLCGAATAAAGPIVFVGLTIPHIARAITGPDYRWILPYAMVLAPILLLASDVVGRLVARPAEVQVGIITAVVGAPVFVALVRRRKVAQL